MSVPRLTFDANIFFYAVEHSAGPKHAQCAAILTAAMHQQAGFSLLQALGEFAYATVRKGVLTRDEAEGAVRDWALTLPLMAADGTVLDPLFSLWERQKLSFWDAHLVAAASQAGATGLVSEDMHDGAVHGGVEIINPFADNAATRLAIHGLTAAW